MAEVAAEELVQLPHVGPKVFPGPMDFRQAWAKRLLLSLDSDSFSSTWLLSLSQSSSLISVSLLPQESLWASHLAPPFRAAFSISFWVSVKAMVFWICASTLFVLVRGWVIRPALLTVKRAL